MHFDVAEQHAQNGTPYPVRAVGTVQLDVARGKALHAQLVRLKALEADRVDAKEALHDQKHLDKIDVYYQTAGRFTSCRARV